MPIRVHLWFSFPLTGLLTIYLKLLFSRNVSQDQSAHVWEKHNFLLQFSEESSARCQPLKNSADIVLLLWLFCYEMLKTPKQNKKLPLLSSVPKLLTLICLQLHLEWQPLVPFNLFNYFIELLSFASLFKVYSCAHRTKFFHHRWQRGSLLPEEKQVKLLTPFVLFH